MPYLIATYDISVNRVAKALKLFRRYLNWVQNSVFEGELTVSQIARLEAEVRDLLEEEDSVLIFELRTTAYMERRTIGAERGGGSAFI